MKPRGVKGYRVNDASKYPPYSYKIREEELEAFQVPWYWLAKLLCRHLNGSHAQTRFFITTVYEG